MHYKTNDKKTIYVELSFHYKVINEGFTFLEELLSAAFYATDMGSSYEEKRQSHSLFGQTL